MGLLGKKQKKEEKPERNFHWACLYEGSNLIIVYLSFYKSEMAEVVDYINQKLKEGWKIERTYKWDGAKLILTKEVS